MMKTKNTKTRTLKQVYDETNERNYLKLAALAEVSPAYAKAFLKKNVSEFEVISNSKIDLEKVDYVPAGNQSSNHYQADILFLPKEMRDLKGNKKFVGVLTLLNTTTRKAYARAVKTTNGDESVKGMKEMLDEARVDGLGVDILRTDGGSEFKSKFKNMLEEMGINHEIGEAHTHNWVGRTNRFHRTLKGMLKVLFALNGNKIWYPHLQSLIDDYNDTPSQAFRDIESLKNPAKSMKGKPFYRPVAPNVVENSGEKFLLKVHEHEASKAAAVKKVDGEKLKVGDHVRLLRPLTKEQTKANKGFHKKSLDNSWTTRVYKIIERTGPNFWRLDEPGDEITQWATYMLKKVSKESYDNQGPAVKTADKQAKQQRVSRAKNDESRNIAPKERKTVPTRTRGSKVITRAAQKAIDAKKKALDER